MMSAITQLRPLQETPALRKVGVVGAGAIGAGVIEVLARGGVEGAELACVVDVHPVPGLDVPQVKLAEAIRRCDVIVECAGQVVVRQHAVEILEAGVDLLVTSVGAFADDALLASVVAAGPGRLLFTSGAVGGVDLLASAAAEAPFERVSVTSRKLPTSVLQPWMDDATQDRIQATTVPVEVFRGPAREAARLFPRSLNVAATVAFAVDSFDLVEVALVADPAAELTTHVIEAEGPTGVYRFEIANRPSPANPRTSGVVPHAVLRSLSVLVGRPVRIV
ncbi:MAG TPA: aspartate dehydrogenase domain-containing protein [Nocardioides sp.]|nr:aspartate dehydrogenase domain-containing protein [Nocardioides sp.]